ncbi:MAG: Hsp20/alpha crystallin family protein [Solirubrobacteraceae bacterium]
MALIRWETQSELHRLFNSLFDTPTVAGVSAPRRWVPAMDVVESQDQYVLRADLPGLSQDDVEIELHGDVLTISGERRSEHESDRGGYRRVERSWGSFHRSLSLPDGVDSDAVQASFERGVLEVKVPKPEQRKPRRVAISVAGGEPQAVEEAADGATGGDHAAA